MATKEGAGKHLTVLVIALFTLLMIFLYGDHASVL
jgi:hypothetical protein